MASFKDLNGREWTIELDAPTVRQIRTECGGIDLLGDDGKAYDRMYDDPLLLCDVLWSILKDEAQAAGIDGKQFFKAVKGDPFEFALAAIQKAITDFFPSQRRKLLETVAEKNAKFREAGMAEALKRLSDPDLERRAIEEMTRQMDSELEKALTQSLSAKSSLDS